MIKDIEPEQNIDTAPPADLLDRIFAQWLDMARYKDTATVERIDYWRRGEWRWCWCVTVTIAAHAASKGAER